MPVLEQKRAPQPPPEHKGDEVPAERARPHHSDQHEQVRMSLARGHTADHHGRLARSDKAGTGCRLEHCHHADHRVGVRAQRSPHVAGDVLKARKLDESAAPRDQR